MKRLLLFFLTVTAASAFAFDHTHAKWDSFLKTYVVIGKDGNSSRVKYKEAKAGRQDLDSYIQELQGVQKAEYESWPETQKQAFLINAYNALTVKWILENGIPKSIKDTGSLFTNPWKKKFFKLFGEDSSLSHIEDDLAEAKWANCRIHFAFTNAAAGSPMLRNEAWRPEKLPAQFDDSTRHFLADRTRNMYDEKSNSLEVSQIFNEYRKDFEKDASCGGSVRAFITHYIKAPDSANVKYLPFDWSLNGG
jgi:hypothetical protein